MLFIYLCILVSLSASFPVYRTPATDNLYDAGLEHGKLARAQIQGGLELLKNIKQFITENERGRQAFMKLKEDNGQHFPRFVKEMEGMAAGAEVDIQDIWMANLQQELSNLMRQEGYIVPNSTHCSDFMAQQNKYNDSISLWHGHNEDWSQAKRPFVYFVIYTATDDADFVSCGGFVYPGWIIGAAITFNRYGISYTQNSISPSHSRDYGLASTFVNRLAAEQKNWQDVVHACNLTNQTMGFNINVISIKEKYAFDFEMYEEQISITPLDTNSSHFNMYKYISVEQPDGPSTIHRQARADSLPAPINANDILSRIGDTVDPDYPIYRSTTLVSSLLNGITGELSIWVDTNPAKSQPVLHFNILTEWE